MTDILTIDSATQYALDQLTNVHHCSDVRLVTANISTEHGIEVVDISFTYDTHDFRHTFSVWLEDGQLYGEW